MLVLVDRWQVAKLHCGWCASFQARMGRWCAHAGTGPHRRSEEWAAPVVTTGMGFRFVEVCQQPSLTLSLILSESNQSSSHAAALLPPSQVGLSGFNMSLGNLHLSWPVACLVYADGGQMNGVDYCDPSKQRSSKFASLKRSSGILDFFCNPVVVALNILHMAVVWTMITVYIKVVSATEIHELPLQRLHAQRTSSECHAKAFQMS